VAIRGLEADVVAGSCNANRIAVNMGKRAGMECERSGKGRAWRSIWEALRGLVTTV
jgi:hypothetical protein